MKKIIIDITSMQEHYIDDLDKKALEYFISLFKQVTDRKGENFDVFDLSLLLYTAFDQEINFGDNVLSFLIAKKYFEKDEIDFTSMYLTYLRCLTQLMNKKLTDKMLESNEYKNIIKTLDNNKNQDKLLIDLLASSIDLKFSKEEITYLQTFLKDITYPKKSWVDGMDQDITYTKRDHALLLTWIVSHALKNNKKDMQKTEVAEKTSNDNSADRLQAAKDAKIW